MHGTFIQADYHLEALVGTHVCYDGYVSQVLHYFKPHADVFRPLGYHPSRVTDKFLSVQPDFHPVVKQSEERSQWKCGDEQSYETELQN